MPISSPRSIWASQGCRWATCWCGDRTRSMTTPNGNDTGATTQGTCIAFTANSDCLAAETILFPDGSTLEFQGIERGGTPAARTIVGGSGRYLGVTGTMTASPSA